MSVGSSEHAFVSFAAAFASDDAPDDAPAGADEPARAGADEPACADEPDPLGVAASFPQPMRTSPAASHALSA
jgi:hypothetical protein